MIAQLHGAGTIKQIAATLVGGTIGIATGLTRYVVLNITQHAAATISARKYGIVGVPAVDSVENAGFLTGTLTITADSTCTDNILVTVFGF